MGPQTGEQPRSALGVGRTIARKANGSLDQCLLGSCPPVPRRILTHPPHSFRQACRNSRSGSYFPPAVKAVPIPKKSGGTRLLGVPTVADRVAQTVVKMMLEPVLEPVFDPNSFGYRPGRSALDAVAIVRRRCWRYDWVVEFDIKGL
ncbi:MAG: hypothetical protein JO277_15380, partial [Candidatus Eremiobacteraeota bacterium]|nr:hypothetical protein [Candidatus Eremiobacteraeota bacterium]